MGKKKYLAPVVKPLGSFVSNRRSIGLFVEGGSNDGNCWQGQTAGPPYIGDKCAGGLVATSICDNGGTAHAGCSHGSVAPNFCTSGSDVAIHGSGSGRAL